MLNNKNIAPVSLLSWRTTYYYISELTSDINKTGTVKVHYTTDEDCCLSLMEEAKFYGKPAGYPQQFTLYRGADKPLSQPDWKKK